jgi:hypothetical protein
MRIRWALIALFCLALIPILSVHLQSAAAAQSGGDGLSQVHSQGPDSRWDNDSFFETIFREPTFKGRGAAFRYGYRAGYEDGRMDIEDGTQQHHGYRYINPDHYRTDFGDRDDYLRNYREGYDQGYRRGYAEPA